MPAIKKKGAIFAIYSDVPEASSSSSSAQLKASSSIPTRSSPRVKRQILSSVQATVPVKRAALEGKQLHDKPKFTIFDDSKPVAAASVSPLSKTKSKPVLGRSRVSDKENEAPLKAVTISSGPRAGTAVKRPAPSATAVTKSAGVRAIKKGTLVAKTIPGVRNGKRYEVAWDADPILGDVSGLYGADPSAEPAGFKDIPTPVRRSRRRSTISSTNASVLASTPKKQAQAC